MHFAHRFVSALFLTAALAASGSIVTAATPQASVQVRVYDSGHHDYHNWDDREDHAYRGYLTDNHQDYRAYNKESHKQQQAYWNWRHAHPDSN